uniref:Rho GTPase activating protein 27 n=1 Tax=Malurus cyaneus samueli TaxID=2593467 RepID=A0A8C5U9F1_9PASS
EETPDPIYLNIQELREEAAAAAASSAPEEPGGSVSDWETHTDTDSGHLFYYNPVTGQTTWDCPFGQDGVSPAASPAPSLAHSPELPEWEQHVDQGSGQTFFYNWVTGETSWDPPAAGDAGSPREMHPGGMRYGAVEQRPPTPETDYPDLSPDELEGYPEEDYSPVGSYEQGASPSGSWLGRHRVPSAGQKERGEHREGHPAWRPPTTREAGVLNPPRTWTGGSGSKNWSSSWTVLEGGILTFFKDSKHSAASALRHPNTLTTPEHTVELRGAALTWAGRDKSSKKNVLELRTREGSEFLIQHDSEQIIAAWHRAIADSIEAEAENRAEFGSREKLGGGEERRAAAAGQVTGSADSDTSRVRNKLRKFLQRRPTLQSLRERGYIKDRFGLAALSPVSTCPGLDIDGLYRVSGNLATIQKLRYKVEHDEQLDLDDGRWEDIHVVTGALKLFLRELPEPLVPFSHFDKFIAAISEGWDGMGWDGIWDGINGTMGMGWMGYGIHGMGMG